MKKYTLIGSQTSPFVRRIRILLDGIPYDLKELNIYETDDSIVLQKVNPVNQIPVLLDGDQKIWDSRQIFNYLNSIHQFSKMDWEAENTLTAIEGAMNSGVALLLMQRSGMKTDEPYMYVNRQKERITSVLDYLKPYIESKALAEWNFLTISLYCFLDWANFRKIINLDERPECQRFLKHHSEKEVVQRTAIPKV